MGRSFGWMNSEKDWGRHLAPKHRLNDSKPLEITDVWPRVFAGVIRLLAHEERKKSQQPYLRVFFGDCGRRGYPGGGGLGLEVNGRTYRFTPGVKRFPEYHDGSGNLTREGELALASGVSGFLATNCDWHWIHLEHQLNLKKKEIESIARRYSGLEAGEIKLDIFQSHHWADVHQKEILWCSRNCATMILDQIRNVRGGIRLEEYEPFQAIRYLQERIGIVCSRLDRRLESLLDLDEIQIQDRLQALAKLYDACDWRAIAKGQAPVPEWLSLDMFREK